MPWAWCGRTCAEPPHGWGGRFLHVAVTLRWREDERNGLRKFSFFLRRIHGPWLVWPGSGHAEARDIAGRYLVLWGSGVRRVVLSPPWGRDRRSPTGPGRSPRSPLRFPPPPVILYLWSCSAPENDHRYKITGMEGWRRGGTVHLGEDRGERVDCAGPLPDHLTDRSMSFLVRLRTGCWVRPDPHPAKTQAMPSRPTATPCPTPMHRAATP